MEFILFLLFVVVALLLSGIRVIKQYEKGVVLTLGKYAGIKEPGLRVILPGIQTMRVVDVRTKTVDVPNQEVITKDNMHEYNF